MNTDTDKKMCEMCLVKPAIDYGQTHLEIFAYMCENCFKFYGVKIAFRKEENPLDKDAIC